MRNVLALLGAGLLAGCTPPERIAAFRQCLSEAYMEHYGEGEAGTAREREDGYALFWQTVMAAAPTYDHLASYDIHVRGRKRYEADPRSFVEAGRAWSRIVFERCGAGVFPDEDRYRMLGLFSRLPEWCDPPTGVPPSPRPLGDMGTPPAAGPELP